MLGSRHAAPPGAAPAAAAHADSARAMRPPLPGTAADASRPAMHCRDGFASAPAYRRWRCTAPVTRRCNCLLIASGRSARVEIVEQGDGSRDAGAPAQDASAGTRAAASPSAPQHSSPDAACHPTRALPLGNDPAPWSAHRTGRLAPSGVRRRSAAAMCRLGACGHHRIAHRRRCATACSCAGFMAIKRCRQSLAWKMDWTQRAGGRRGVRRRFRNTPPRRSGATNDT
jgi:hypothetical protein